jgi:hypothetical protein
VGSVDCFVEELLDDWADHLLSRALPDCGIGFDFTSYLFYGHVRKL